MFQRIAGFFCSIADGARSITSEDAQLAEDASQPPSSTPSPEDTAIARYDSGVDGMVKSSRDLK